MEKPIIQNVGGKRDWALTQGAFHSLLDWLDEGADSRGERYLEMRHRLVLYFDRKNCASPDELADETLNRVARNSPDSPNATCSFTVTVQACAITCPSDIGVNNTPGQCGAAVTFAPTPSPACGTVTCSPASGSFFPVGATTVLCSTAVGPSCSFTVKVIDIQPPTINCPANIVAAAAVTCPLSSSAPVIFTVTASDNCSGVTVVCKNQNNQVVTSGSLFPVGTTTVTCMATDASGNIATRSFTVTMFGGCLQDDSDPSVVVLFNTQTGEHRFCCGGTVFTGTGTVMARGCSVSIQHNAPDRRVQINFDGAMSVGFASLQAPAGTIRCTIQDRDTSDNNCLCQ